MFKHRLAVYAAIATAVLFAGASTALAFDAVAKSAVNVRTGPGKTFGIADQLEAGEEVVVSECAPSGWCFVEHNGPDGWVSATFLTSPEDDEDEGEQSEGGGSNPNCGFGFAIGPDGKPSLSINCGDAPPPAPPAPPADDDDEEEADGPQACFYVNAGFDGSSFCMGEGTKNSLNATFKDKITSVEISGGLKVKLCVDNNLGGYCKTVTTDTEDLPAQIDNKANSVLVFTGAEPEEPFVLNPGVIKILPKLMTPDTFSTDGINWKLSYTIDLDTGSQGEGSGNDLWYEIGDGENFITPTNGGKIALGDFGQHGWSGCSSATFTTAKLSTQDAGVGSYICVKTNEGRISEFRINGYEDDFTMKIGYTTWAN